MRYACALAALLLACSVDDPESTGEHTWTYEPAEPPTKDCSGTLYSNGCDDCNPCTFDNWCDPLEWDAFIPEWCVEVATTGVAQCVHAERSTPEGQINDCFPITPITDVRPGKCCAGTCIDNEGECMQINLE